MSIIIDNEKVEELKECLLEIYQIFEEKSIPFKLLNPFYELLHKQIKFPENKRRIKLLKRAYKALNSVDWVEQVLFNDDIKDTVFDLLIDIRKELRFERIKNEPGNNHKI